MMPETVIHVYRIEPLLNNGSFLEDESGDQVVTPDEKEYEGDDWGSRRHDHNKAWDDEAELENDDLAY